MGVVLVTDASGAEGQGQNVQDPTSSWRGQEGRRREELAEGCSFLGQQPCLPLGPQARPGT